jgi:hypothetical protein
MWAIEKHRAQAQQPQAAPALLTSAGVLWHVLLNPQRISLNQLRAFQLATGDNDCRLMNGTAVVEDDSDTTQAERNKTDGDLRRLVRRLHSEGAAHTWNSNATSGMHCGWPALAAGLASPSPLPLPAPATPGAYSRGF